MDTCKWMAQKNNRINPINIVEACVLAILLVAVLTFGFYRPGAGAILGLLVSLFILVRFLGITWV